MRPYNVIPGWAEGPDPESQEENFGIPGSRVSRAPRNDWKELVHVEIVDYHV